MSLVSPSEIYDSKKKCLDEIGISDEMQAHIPQDYGSVIEIQELMGVNNLIMSSQSNKPMMGIIQDCLLGTYLLTHPDVILPKHHFMNCLLSGGQKYLDKFDSKFNYASHFYNNPYNGRVLFSFLLPDNFNYQYTNNASKTDPTIIIKNGILINGIIDKKIIGRTHNSIIHRLFKEYNPKIASDFLSDLQFIVNRWLTYRGFSVSVNDFLISNDNQTGVKDAIAKAFIEVENIQNSNDNTILKEFRINNALNNRGQSLAINGLCSNNRLEVMINSGSKGSKMNIIQITGHLGQNNVDGKRIQYEINDNKRTLPCFNFDYEHPTTRGFIKNSFITGLNPSEFWFHSKAGREGVINTAVKTKDSGYAERKLVKRMEDMILQLDFTVRNSTNIIISFNYGDLIDPTQLYLNDGPSFINIDNIVTQLNAEIDIAASAAPPAPNNHSKFNSHTISTNLIQSSQSLKIKSDDTILQQLYTKKQNLLMSLS